MDLATRAVAIVEAKHKSWKGNLGQLKTFKGVYVFMNMCIANKIRVSDFQQAKRSVCPSG